MKPLFKTTISELRSIVLQNISELTVQKNKAKHTASADIRRLCKGLDYVDIEAVYDIARKYEGKKATIDAKISSFEADLDYLKHSADTYETQDCEVVLNKADWQYYFKGLDRIEWC